MTRLVIIHALTMILVCEGDASGPVIARFALSPAGYAAAAAFIAAGGN